jgi:transposase
VKQTTDSDGTVYAMPDTDKLDTQIARKQGWPKDRRPKSNRGRSDNATHQVSRTLADTVYTVVVEDLNTKAMPKSVKGTVEKPGRQVKQKSGLNRSILASSWGSLDRKLAYTSQAVFACGICRFRANAAHNAAINILVRAGLPYMPVSARGTGAAARRGAIVEDPDDL